ncbi:MAG: multiprotein bridging factor aMBF1 [Candidatus Woesearchaeota archaeon]
MASCEMCGKEDILVIALIEGVELNVCNSCASFGKIVKKQSPEKINEKKELKKEKKVEEREVIMVVREDFSSIIKNKREKMGLKQDEFAKFLNEKESIVQKIENGTYIPSIEMARKLEKQLNISLIEERVVEPQHIKAKNETLTIGDMINLKNK